MRRLSTKHGGAGGAIVNIASVAARLGGLPGLVPYAATKGAIETFTRGLANEVAREGVRVNAVSPGMVATDMTTPILSQPGSMERIGFAHSDGRAWVSPRDRRGGGLADLARGSIGDGQHRDGFGREVRAPPPVGRSGSAGLARLGSRRRGRRLGYRLPLPRT